MTAQNGPVVISLADETEMPHPADAAQVIDQEDEKLQGGERPKARATRGYAKRLGGLFAALCFFYVTIGFWNLREPTLVMRMCDQVYSSLPLFLLFLPESVQ